MKSVNSVNTCEEYSTLLSVLCLDRGDRRKFLASWAALVKSVNSVNTC